MPSTLPGRAARRPWFGRAPVKDNSPVVAGLAAEWHEGSPDVLLLLGHATGFCKEVWRPTVDCLRELGVEASVLAWDARGHGSSPALESPVTWWTFGRDLEALIAALPAETGFTGDLVGVGHSMGGATVVMAETLSPSFVGMVLAEPVIMPPPYRRRPDNPLSVLAAKRRPVFPSLEAAADSYRSKPLFADWHADAFAGYLEGGFRSHPQGAALVLPPELEAEVFAASAECGIHARMGEVEPPVRLLVSDERSMLSETMPAISSGFPNIVTSYMTGQSHLMVMERPDLVAAEIADFLRSL